MARDLFRCPENENEQANYEEVTQKKTKKMWRPESQVQKVWLRRVRDLV